MNKKILLILLICTSCAQKLSTSLFEDILFNRIFMANEVSFGHEKNLNQGIINRPKNTWINLLTAKVGKGRFCLVYKVPGKDDGVLELRESESSCDHYKGELVSSLNGVKDLSVYFFKEGKIIKRKKIRESHLYLKFKRDKESTEIIIPMVGISSKEKGERYSNGLKERLVEGVLFRVEPIKVKKVMSGLYRDKRAYICHEVNKNCEDTISNTCSECPYGSYEVINYKCKQGGTKFCGPSYCGRRGEPACIRGQEFLDVKGADLCFHGSPAGHCLPGLKTYCDENKILVCL